MSFRLIPAVLLILALHAVPAAQTIQRRPAQAADGVVRLLTDLESAVASGRRADFQSLAAPSLPQLDYSTFDRVIADGPSSATIRERNRLPSEDGYQVLVELFVSRGRQGRVATWQITTRPKPDAPDRFEITGLLELSSLSGLIKLTLDTDRQFAVRNLTFRAPDLTLKMTSGSAFVAEAEGGVTALVLHGEGELRFTPPDPAEQGQLKIFAGRPELTTTIDGALIRINPDELSSHMSEQSLAATRLDRDELDWAQETFDQFAGRTFNLDLRDLSQDRWSISPSYGATVVEFRSRRHGWLTYVRSPHDAEDISLFDRARTRNISNYGSAAQIATRGRFFSEDDGIDYDVLRYGLDLTFDPERSWISGRGSLRVRITTAATSTLTFRLAQSLVVTSVSSPAFGRLLALRVIGQNNLIVSLPTYVQKGTELIFDILYTGRLSPQPADREALAVFGVQGSDRQERTEPIMPEPRFMYSNRVYWYPQSQVTDYATSAMRLTVPSEFQVVASGTLVGSSVITAENPGRSRSELKSVRTVEFSADRPVRYLACLISRFVPVGRTRVDVPAIAPPIVDDPDPAPATPGRSVTLEVISTPRRTNVNRQTPGRAADILRFYASTIQETPYPNFTLAAVDDNLPGGHSPAFFAILNQPLPTTPYVWGSDPVAFEQQPFFFLAHELAHQWWGQAVGWKNYHEQWISEGLAQYFAVMYTEADRGPEAMRNLLAQMRRSAADMSSQGPISLGYRLGHIQGDSRIFRAILYNKSAVVLHMLRRLIGDDAFMRGLRRFYREFRFRKAGTEDFRLAFEAESSRRLDRFFEMWMRNPALPQLRLTSRVEASGSYAIVRVEQLGDPFDLPLTVTVQYTDGRLEDVNLAITEPVVESRIALKGAVRRIVARDELTLANIVN